MMTLRGLTERKRNFIDYAIHSWPLISAVIILLMMIVCRNTLFSWDVDRAAHVDTESSIRSAAVDIGYNEFFPGNVYSFISDDAVSYNASDNTFELSIKDEATCQKMTEKYKLNCRNNLLVAPNALGADYAILTDIVRTNKQAGIALNRGEFDTHRNLMTKVEGLANTLTSRSGS